MTRGAYLGPSGIGQAALWALQELPTADGKPAQRGFQTWAEIQNQHTNHAHARSKDRENHADRKYATTGTVLKVVTGG